MLSEIPSKATLIVVFTLLCMMLECSTQNGWYFLPRFKLLVKSHACTRICSTYIYSSPVLQCVKK